MLIELTIPERLHLLTTFPKEGNYITLKLIRDLISKVGLTAQEITAYEIREANGVITWNNDGSKPTVIEFIDSELELIRKGLQDLNVKNKLTSDTLTLYEKFCT